MKTVRKGVNYPIIIRNIHTNIIMGSAMTPRRVSEKTIIILWLPAVVKALNCHSALPTLRLLILLYWIKRIVHPKLLSHPFTHRHFVKLQNSYMDWEMSPEPRFTNRKNFTKWTPTAATDFNEKH